MRVVNDMKRLFRLALGSALVAGLVFGCAPRLMATGDPLYAPRLDPTPNAQILNAAMSDGARLPMRLWAADHPHAVIIGVHGMNDYSNAFDMPGRWFAARGVTMLAYDQRGFGQAPGRGLWAGSARMADDLDTVVTLARKKIPRPAGLSHGRKHGWGCCHAGFRLRPSATSRWRYPRRTGSLGMARHECIL
jgi:hypothetical protein